MMKTIEGYTYKVGEHIGKGYSSTVHRGMHDKTGENVSIKVIQMQKLQDPVNQMLLQLQVTALKALSHSPHVLRLLDVYATRNNTYIITELMEGDLSQILKQRKSLNYLEAVDILRQLISGYLDVHRAGFVHRDIKPANIFYRNGVYKIGDFGFAVPAADLIQHRNYNVGSPVYMPPQALKDNIYTISCDTWALGVLFYQMIRGSVPWRAVSEQVLHDKMVNEPIDGLTVGMPEPARKFLAQMLHIDPKQRLNPDQLHSWPNQLASCSIEPVRSLSPFEGRNLSPFEGGRVVANQPLRELKNLSLGNRSTNNLLGVQNFVKQIVSPMGQQQRTNFFSKDQVPKIKQKIDNNQNIQNIPPVNYQASNKQNELSEENEFRQAYFFSCNFLSFLKFLHRVLKFITPPTSINLPELESAITAYLFKQMQQLKSMLDLKSDGKVDRWEEFTKAAKGQMIRKKAAKSEAKYRMFHEINKDLANRELDDSLIKDGIMKIMSYLQNQQNFNSKLVIGADYLTTLLQLVHLRQKYEWSQFLKVSKIDLIMQGNPYSATGEHLAKLRKKLVVLNL